jgi:hypothetical protein
MIAPAAARCNARLHGARDLGNDDESICGPGLHSWIGHLHGYAVARRLNQVSHEALQVQLGSLYPALAMKRGSIP